MGADSDSNKDCLDHAGKDLDETDNIINGSNLLERRVQLETIVGYGLQRVDEKRTNVKDQIAQAAKMILWAKNLIGEAVKACPEASIAWAGVCIILPLLTNPSTADEANRDGFTYVTTRMRYYAALEPLLLDLGQDSGVLPCPKM
jgi:hypothetical protein